MEDIAEVDNELDKLQKKIRELEIKKKNLLDMSEVERIAVTLHSRMCTSNHTDGCDWYYDVKNGKHDWNGHAHQTYLKKAKKIVLKCEALKIKPSDALALLQEIDE